ncbi:Abortive infection bacteriophage resistance protein [Peptoniphilus asaccharolyticus DSM 20463]|uniref:Abortive infection bacteriophage resistance protein n=1 Tax=Peptoniphilus asaccharolyticus DSM 20463 TaxID=573058 RepID=A0A1W1V1R8_PEPAS|nr:Abi family protein [Peptoniphilus asaccharolyticus]MBL7575561.1 Abi family protein [Peptoniphilus asaccharolyticus]SMB87265.1 Abortive infection bacteriophage resistance protein [Peptoniphilus asaccharolyticus DSM 20463]
MQYDKPFKTYSEQIEHLNIEYNLTIDDIELATALLSTFSYYDLINGYKDCFMVNNKYITGTTIEDLYVFNQIDKDIQNLLFKYSVIVENRFKTILAYHVSKQFGVDISNYVSLNVLNHKKAYESKKVIDDLNKITTSTYCQQPTKHYRDFKNHIPAWILFKNATFSTTINYFMLLSLNLRNQISQDLYTRSYDCSDEEMLNFITSSLKIVKKFRNVIAHNLKFVSTRSKDFLILKHLSKEYSGNLILRSDNNNNIGKNDPYSMIIALITLLNENFLIQNFINDFGRLLYVLEDSFGKTLIQDYFKHCHLPNDLEKRLKNYLTKIQSKI